MDFDLKRIFPARRDGHEGPSCHLDGDKLIIDCRGCQFTPMPGSRECVRCMVDNMSLFDGGGRLILRTGKDIEITGRSRDIIRRISSLKRWSVPLMDKDRKCARCGMSRAVLMDDVWGSFPDMGFSSARSALNEEGSDERCARCIRSSFKALDQLESDMDSIRSEIGGWMQ